MQLVFVFAVHRVLSYVSLFFSLFFPQNVKQCFGNHHTGTAPKMPTRSSSNALPVLIFAIILAAAVAQPALIRLNCGGSSFVDSIGNAWAADSSLKPSSGTQSVHR